ncbi:uncharacterized protein LOC113748687 [Coffea eugenioides]|uniref:uncharacterized protein LOC113748687 n=1 Tax=Coffea eugenioides TaxID=49369 RepID=UPI000F605924|nr:uncharacterized protein LOC113748687 [Coffea eugenioides]
MGNLVEIKIETYLDKLSLGVKCVTGLEFGSLAAYILYALGMNAAPNITTFLRLNSEASTDSDKKCCMIKFLLKDSDLFAIQVEEEGEMPGRGHRICKPVKLSVHDASVSTETFPT